VLVNQPVGSGLEIALLGETRRATCGGLVAVPRCRAVTRHFKQVCADGVEAVVLGGALVVVQRAQQVEPGLRAADYRHGD
jgi:hypothetical protein